MENVMTSERTSILNKALKDRAVDRDKIVNLMILLSRIAGALSGYLLEFTPLSLRDINWVIQNPREASILFCRAIKNRDKEQLLSHPIFEALQVGNRSESAEDFGYRHSLISKHMILLSRMVGALSGYLLEFTLLSFEDVNWVMQNSQEASILFCRAIKNRDKEKLLTRSVFKTLKIGCGPKNIEGFIEAIKNQGGNISRSAMKMLQGLDHYNTPLAQEETSIDLITLTTNDLLLGEGGHSPWEVFRHAISIGFNLVIAEVAFQLVLNGCDLPKDVRLIMGMPPIQGDFYESEVLSVTKKNEGIFLDTMFSDPKYQNHSSSDVWVFSINILKTHQWNGLYKK